MGLNTIRSGFDQEAAAALMARYSVFKTRTDYTFDILRWLDRMLIRLVIITSIIIFLTTITFVITIVIIITLSSPS
jgi:hypothetical protein